MRRWGVLAVLAASLLIVAMDATILNVALPSLIDDMRPGAIAQLWIIDVYGLVLGGLLVTAGAVGDRWGRRRLFLTGLAVFGAASIAAALSMQPWQLIAARVLLGCGGAMIMPSTLSLIRHVFTDERERATAIAVWAAAAGVGVAIGPVLGGTLVEAFGWSAAFWVNVPVILVTFSVGAWLLPESRTPSTVPLNLFDVPLSIAGMVLLVAGVKQLTKSGLWSIAPLLLLAGLALLAWFVRRQLHATDPLLDVRLFAGRPFTAAALVTFTGMMGIGAALYLLSLWMQYVEGYSPLRAGLHMSPLAIALLVSSLSTPRLTARFGVRKVLAAGLVALVLGFTAIALAQDGLSYPVVAFALVTFGIGDGMGITTSASVMLSAAPPERSGGAAAVSETAYELGVAFGVALLGSVTAVAYRHFLDSVPTPHIKDSIGSAIDHAADIGGPTGDYIARVAREAYVDALHLTAGVSAILIAITLALVLSLVPRTFKATETGH
ncbi:MFS transporter [Spirillospora sp. CA-253888]